ncbi:PAS domain-containing protein [Anabaena azotica]|uniref:PAS domain-containing protein n=1 Tax=Anabaena azotica TaxID=197653 RepID=UPI0039A78285
MAATILTDLNLESAIARYPLTIAPTACVVEAITLMSAGGTTCSFTCEIDAEPDLIIAQAQSSCVLVVEDNRLVGIVTERDLVRLSSRGCNLADLTIAEVMVSPVITLEISQFTNLFVPLNIFQHHHIRHLPLVDEQGKVVGLLTHESLRQLLRPIDLLHLRVASEVMTTSVVHTQPTAMIMEITQLMTTHRVSSVIIVDSSESDLIPIGIITERDIVQFLALELDFDTIQAQTVMSTPVFSVRGDISLWSVRLLMQERQINRVLVTDEENRLLGIVTQTSLLNVLNPMEIYRMVETLEEKVSRLEFENLKLLQARNIELEQQVKERTSALQIQVKRERLLTKMAAQIRSSLNLEEILNTAVAEVRRFLKCDRILVYKFEPDWNGIVVAESVGEGWTECITDQINDLCFSQRANELYGQGKTIAINNIHQAGYTECHLQLLERYQVKANLVVPILVSGQLWGLLIGHHCADYRHWDTTELTFLDKIAIQLAIAIQQATAHQEAKTELAERQKAETALRNSEEKFRQFAENSHGVMLLRQIDSGQLIYVNPAYEKIWGQSCQSLYQDPDSWMTFLHPDDQERIHTAHQTAAAKGFFSEEYRIVRADGSIRWIWGRCFPIEDSFGQVYRIAAMAEDITERKLAEAAIQEKEQFLRSIYEGIEQAVFTVNVLENGEFQFLAFNPACERLTGMLTEEMRGKPPAPAMTQHYRDCIQAGVPICYEESISFQGKMTWWITTLTPIRDTSSRIYRIVGTSTPITQRKHTELALQQSQSRLAEAQRVAKIGNWEFENQTGKITWSAELFRILKRDPSLGEPTYLENLQLYHPDDAEKLHRAVEQAIYQGQSYQLLLRAYQPDGSFRFVEAIAKAEIGEQGLVKRLFGTIQDVNERVLAEQTLAQLNQELEIKVEQRTAALRASEERWHLALKGANDGIWDFDLKTNKIFFSTRWKTMRGFSEDQIGDSPQECFSRIHPDDYDRVMAAVEDHFAGKTEFFEIEYRMQCKDGSYMWVLDRAQALRDEFGQVIRITGSETDISQRKQVEEQLRNLSERLELALNAAKIGIWEWDIVSDRLIWDQRMYELYGVEPSNFTGTYQAWEASLHPDDLATNRAIAEQAMAGEKDFNTEYRIVWPDGTIKVIKAYAIVQRNPQGEAQRMIGVNFDMSNFYNELHLRKQAEAELREMNTAMQNAVEGIARLDTQGRYISINPAYAHICGYEPDEMIGMMWQRTVHPEDIANMEVAYDQMLKTGKVEAEARGIRKDGTVFYKQVTMVSAYNEQGEFIGNHCFMKDVSERKQAELALKDSQQFIQQIADASPNILYLCDIQEGRNIYVNREIATILGYTAEQIQAMGSDLFPTVLHPDDLMRLPAQYERLQAAQDGEILDYEYRMQNSNGSWRWLYSRDSIFKRDESGKVKLIIGTAQDITDRKETELENQLLKERMQFILSSSPAIIYTCKPDGDFEATFISDNIQNILGYTTAEFLERSDFWTSHIHPEDLPGVFANLPILLTQGHHVYEYRFQHKNGDYLWMQDEQRIVKDSEGVIVEIVGYFADISDRKRLEQEQNRLIAILEASTDYIGMSDAAGKILWNNAEFRRLLNVDNNTSVNEKILNDYHPQWAVRLVVEEGIPGAIANGTWVGETALLNAQGEEIPVSQLIIAHKSPQGEIEFFSTILRDIRVRKEYEQRLERSNAELTRATRLKDEFLANMSHELRTPLNAILGLSESLQEEVFGVLNERQKHSLSTIERSGRHLLELINDILDVSKIGAGKLELEMSSVSVNHLCKSSLAFVKQQAMQKRINLKTVFPEELEEIIVDERRMRQVLINLLNNAVKFTPAGGQVTLDVHLEYLKVCQLDQGCPPSEPNFLYSLCFSIIDTGIGIAPTDIDKLFQPFIQIDSSLNRKYAGTGLGLTLVKQIVELHGASISVSSETGTGSCFTVRLPYIPKRSVNTIPQTVSVLNLPQLVSTTEQPPQIDVIKNQASDIADEEVITQPVILLAEDNQANISTLSAYLEARGYQIILAKNGQEAIALATMQTPNLILMDIQMPEMDGLEAMRQIRANPQLVSIPIIALTALAMPGDEEKCLEAGANEYLSKPVTLKQLVEMIQKLLRK